MMQGMEDPTGGLVDFGRKRSLDDDKSLGLGDSEDHEAKKAKQTVDSILNQAEMSHYNPYLPPNVNIAGTPLSHLSITQINQQLSQLNQMNQLGTLGQLTDAKDSLPLVGVGVDEKTPFLCQYCGIDLKTANLRRKHYKEQHPLEFQLKKKIPTPASKPVQPIDNALRTVFGMTQIKKMPGDVRDKRLRIQTLEKRILPKLVEWWGGNAKLFTQDLLQTEFLREALHEYLRKERY